MKILLISDEESPFLWDYYRPGNLDGIDMILSCGDQKKEYLEFLVTMSGVPLYYVHGNHDGSFEKMPPEGCECIEDRIINYGGIRILGFGGCMCYSGGPHQYTEEQMRRRIRKMRLKLHKAGGVDIVLAHAPIRGCGDANDLAHIGFEAFRELTEKYRPKYFIHGHIHRRYGYDLPRVQQFGETTVVNACERYIIEI